MKKNLKEAIRLYKERDKKDRDFNRKMIKKFGQKICLEARVEIYFKIKSQENKSNT